MQKRARLEITRAGRHLRQLLGNLVLQTPRGEQPPQLPHGRHVAGLVVQHLPEVLDSLIRLADGLKGLGYGDLQRSGASGRLCQPRLQLQVVAEPLPVERRWPDRLSMLGRLEAGQIDSDELLGDLWRHQRRLIEFLVIELNGELSDDLLRIGLRGGPGQHVTGLDGLISSLLIDGHDLVEELQRRRCGLVLRLWREQGRNIRGLLGLPNRGQLGHAGRLILVSAQPVHQVTDVQILTIKLTGIEVVDHLFRLVQRDERHGRLLVLDRPVHPENGRRLLLYHCW